MAKANTQVKKTTTLEGVTLTLTPTEAAAILLITGNIAGTGPCRDAADNVYYSLLGVFGDEAGRALSGDLKVSGVTADELNDIIRRAQ